MSAQTHGVGPLTFVSSGDARLRQTPLQLVSVDLPILWTATEETSRVEIGTQCNKATCTPKGELLKSLTLSLCLSGGGTQQHTEQPSGCNRLAPNESGQN